MLNIQTCHVIQFPSGRWGYVGRIPVTLCRIVPADRSAVLGGRAFRDDAGDLVEAKGRVFDTEAEARDFAADAGVPVR